MIVVCVDVGSTYTKAAAVQDGRLVATGSHRTTVETDVLQGLDAAVEATGARPDALLACSSAGGGLRLAVIGFERLVTAEAGHRVGLSAGAKVVHVAAGKLDRAALAQLRAARPDVVLLAGGTDGGDTETLLHNATRLAKARWRIPVVLAGNADCRSTIEDLLPGGVRPGDRRGQRPARDRRAGPGAGAGRHPRRVPQPCDRRQEAVEGPALRVAGARGNPRSGADRRGAAGRSDRGRSSGGRCGRSNHRCVLSPQKRRNGRGGRIARSRPHGRR